MNPLRSNKALGDKKIISYHVFSLTGTSEKIKMIIVGGAMVVYGVNFFGSTLTTAIDFF